MYKRQLYLYKGKVQVSSLTMVDDLLSVAKCGIDSVETNAFINAKMELKRLILNSDKCHKLHIGQCKGSYCSKLRAHEIDMEQVLEDSYLGDIVSSSGKHHKNIKARCGKLMGVISTIMVILNELCLGTLYFEIALLLRETMFLSVKMLNSDTWTNLTKQDIDDLESLDKLLLKRILQTSSSTPNCAVFLELGVEPVRFLIQGKILLFLHHILTRKENELIFQVYKAQKSQPIENDFSEIVRKDMADLDINSYTDKDIASMSKFKWKKIVKSSIKTTALKYLLEESNGKSKMENLTYDCLQLQEYLKSSTMSKTRKLLALKLRCRMTPVANNQGQKIKCKLCDMGSDDQPHLINCVLLKLRCPDILSSQEEYKDLFGSDVEKIDKLTTLFEKVLREREILLQ